MDKKIAVIGYGYVGKAMSELLTNRYDIDVYDPALNIGQVTKRLPDERMTSISRLEQKAKKYDLAVICTPTPMQESGECDISYVLDAVKNTHSDLYLIKSTVEPGTTETLSKITEKHIVFSPEYVGESQYYNSYFPDKMIETPFHIFGGAKEDTSQVIDYLLPILGPDKQYFQMTAKEAEIVKYMENTFFATKITFCQEMYDICNKVGADWNSVREAWLADPRINPMHTAVFKDDRGFGGKCLPKDTNALAEYARKNNVEPILLDAVLKKNKSIRKSE